MLFRSVFNSTQVYRGFLRDQSLLIDDCLSWVNLEAFRGLAVLISISLLFIFPNFSYRIVWSYLIVAMGLT